MAVEQLFAVQLIWLIHLHYHMNPLTNRGHESIIILTRFVSEELPTYVMMGFVITEDPVQDAQNDTKTNGFYLTLSFVLL